MRRARARSHRRLDRLALCLAVVVLPSASLRGQSPSDGTEVDELASLRTELIERAARDQAVRSQDIGAMTDAERTEAFAEWRAVDRENTARLKEIVELHGWPTYAMVGREASNAAFLLAQHADHDPEFQARCLPLLQAAVQRGEGSPTGLAYLTDRVRVAQDRPQLYGTQYYVREAEDGSVLADENGLATYLLPVVEDVDALDERRRRMGLSPWASYERDMAGLHGRAPASAPRAWNGALPVDPQATVAAPEG